MVGALRPCAAAVAVAASLPWLVLAGWCPVAGGIVHEDKLSRLQSFRGSSSGESLAQADGLAPPPPLVRCRLQDGQGDVMGNVTIALYREWAPLGVDRFLTLVSLKWFDGCVFFRALRNFVVQWGMHSRSEDQAWTQLVGSEAAKEARSRLRDDPVATSNRRGTVTFAMGGPNTRTTQLYINLKNNKYLDREGFSPIGQVVAGMDIVDQIDTSYRDGQGQTKAYMQGRDVLLKNFPKMWSIEQCSVHERG